MGLQDALRTLGDRLLLGAGTGAAPVWQAGAIPYMVVKGQVVFLLITSRRTGRWIFPKGGIIEGMTPWDAAAYEAFEEAGIEGEIERTPIGSYRAVKLSGIRRVLLVVDMYPMRVTRQLDEWPESAKRHRHWAILPEARRLLADARLAEVAAHLSRREVANVQPAMGLSTQ